jgi:8-amino-7-oxononanoate synthase
MKYYNGVQEQVLQIPNPKPQSPIFSLLTPEPRSLARYCQEGGFVVRPIVPPTVAEGTQRVRVCLHSGNTLKDVEGLVERIRGWLGIVGSAEARELPKLEFKSAL